MAYADGRFWAVPSRQIFSRHLGVCLILGDKSVRGGKHKLQVKPDQDDTTACPNTRLPVY